jgi:2-methylcitrate dehydratase PrpD
MTPNQARLCIGYVSARALLNGQLGVEDFTPEARTDPNTIALARKVMIAKDDNPDPNALAPISVTVRLTDGQVFERTQALIYGNPAKPMTREAHLTKFRANWQSGAAALPAENAETLIEMIDDIDNVADIREITALMEP